MMDEQKPQQELLASVKDAGKTEAQLVVETSSSKPNLAAFNERRVLSLSVTHIIIGLICIAFNSILIALAGGGAVVGQGIWGGVVFLINGSIGECAVKHKTQCMIKLLKLSSIVAAGVSVAVLGLAINAAVNVQRGFYTYTSRVVTQSYGSQYNGGQWYGQQWNSNTYWDQTFINNDMFSTEVALESLIAVLSAVAGLMAIWTTVICFKTVGFTLLPFSLTSDGPGQPAFNVKTVLRVSIAQIVLGFICILFHSILLGLVKYGQWTNVGHGIWGGVVFLANGVIGVAIVRSKARTQGMISALKTMSLFSAVLSVVVMGLAINAAANPGYYYYNTRDIQTGLQSVICVFAATCGLLAMWTYVICLKTLGQSWGCMLYYGYQVSSNGTSQLVFVPQPQQKQGELLKSNIIEESSMYTAIGFSFPPNKQPAVSMSIAPPPYVSSVANAIPASLPTIDEPVTVVIPVEPDKF